MNTEDVRVGFIGFGNMGQAIADGFLYKKTLKPEQMCACAGHFDKLKETAGKRGITAYETAEEVAKNADLLVVAVKPWMVEAVMKQTAPLLEGKIIWSVAAGMMYEDYAKLVPAGTHHATIIPNTPAAVGEGIFTCEKVNSLTEEEFALLEKLLTSIGQLIVVDTEKVTIANTVSGCGPAYASMFLEALGDVGVMYGLSRQDAYRLAAGMMAGTGKLMLEQGKHPGQMKDDVCSPGGSTILGVAALEKAGLRSAVIEAVKASMSRY